MATRSPYYKPSLGISGPSSTLDKQIDLDNLDLSISREYIISTISKELRSGPKIKMIYTKKQNKTLNPLVEQSLCIDDISDISNIEFKLSDIDILKLSEAKTNPTQIDIPGPMQIDIPGPMQIDIPDKKHHRHYLEAYNPESSDTKKSIHSSMITPSTSYKSHNKSHNKGIRRESVGLVKPSELNINDVSFIANDFSTDLNPLLSQQQKMATNSGLIDIDDVSYMVVTNVPEKSTTYEYISKGTANIGSYLFSKSAPIASSFMGDLENIAKSAANILSK